LDKAPDAFRTISEVADDLDIPQHVLRFWETRFSQIKPMKRSGGRRYYRPDDVDLLRGIRRLLYGEGYTIRGVQRILREQGVKSVQGLADEGVPPPSPTRRAGRDMSEHDLSEHDLPEHDLPDQDLPDEADALAPERGFEDGEEEVEADEDGLDIEIAPRPVAAVRGPAIRDGVTRGTVAGAPASSSRGMSSADAARLKAALEDLTACKKLVDETLKASAPGLFPLK